MGGEMGCSWWCAGVGFLGWTESADLGRVECDRMSSWSDDNESMSSHSGGEVHIRLGC